MKDQVTWRSSTHLLLSGCTAGNDHNWTSGPVLHTEQWRDPALEGMTTTTNRHGGFTSHISCKRLATFRETMLYTCSGRYIRPAISIFRVLTYSLTYLVTYLLTHLLTYLLNLLTYSMEQREETCFVALYTNSQAALEQRIPKSYSPTDYFFA